MIKSHVAPVTNEEFVVDAVYCNMCGKQIKKIKESDHPIFADNLRIQKDWGYFSNKDGVTDEFNLCEECYDKLIKQFKIPILRKNSYFTK